MVSMYHVGLIMDAYGYSIIWLMKINALLTPIRMPVFFLAAGFVARSSVNRPWLYLFEKRIGFYAYLFVLWSVLRFSFFGNVVPNRLAPLEGNDWTWLISSLVAPETGAWFLWALAIFYSLTKSVESVPARVVIPIGILASVIGFSGIVPMLFSFANILQYFVFFYVACHFQHPDFASQRYASKADRIGHTGVCGFDGAGLAIILLVDRWPRRTCGSCCWSVGTDRDCGQIGKQSARLCRALLRA